MKSIIIDLSSDFIDYIGEDNLILPRTTDKYFLQDQLSDDEDDKLTVISDDVIQQPPHHFPKFEDDVTAGIRSLKGEVFVKLNWSAPSDAIWMNGGTLKCKNIAEILLLLKSSDRVTFDLEKMFTLCNTEDSSNSPIEYKLILRKWANLTPSMEFRVFVVGHVLRGE